MDSIVIVCGAGASSSFLASRMRTIARERGLDARVTAASSEALADLLPSTTVLLVGPHLATGFETIAAQAAEHHVPVALLPETAFGPAGAAEAVDLVGMLVAAGPAPAA